MTPLLSISNMVVSSMGLIDPKSIIGANVGTPTQYQDRETASAFALRRS